MNVGIVSTYKKEFAKKRHQTSYVSSNRRISASYSKGSDSSKIIT